MNARKVQGKNQKTKKEPMQNPIKALPTISIQSECLTDTPQLPTEMTMSSLRGSSIPLKVRQRSRSISRSSTTTFGASASSKASIGYNTTAARESFQSRRSLSSSCIERAVSVLGSVQGKWSISRNATSPGSNLVTPISTIRSRSPFTSAKKKPLSANDHKKWAHDQYVKINTYLQQEYSEFNSDLLKPISIKTFVEIAALLLNTIDSRIRIDMNNYREELLVQLKLFRYPGVISNSLLKTVSATQYWPQVISILGWLSDLARLVKDVQTFSEGHNEPNTLTEIIAHFFTQKYVDFNRGGQEESQLDGEFKQRLEMFFHIDRDGFAKLEETIARLEQEKELHIQQINNYEMGIENMETEIQELKEKTQNIIEKQEARENEMNTNLANAKQSVADLTEEITKHELIVQNLKEQIAQQPYSVNDIKKWELNLEDMRHTCELKKAAKENIQQYDRELDLKILNANMEVKTAVYQINSTVARHSVQYPELLPLKLPTANFGEKAFLEKVKATKELKAQFDQSIKSRIAEDKAKNLEYKNKLEDWDVEFTKMTKRTEDLLREKRELQKKISDISAKRNELVQNQERKEKKLMAAEENAQIVTDRCNRMKNEVDANAQRLSQMNAEYEMAQEDTLKFYDTVHQQSAENINTLRMVLDTTTDNLRNTFESIIKEQESVIEALERMKKHCCEDES